MRIHALCLASVLLFSSPLSRGYITSVSQLEDVPETAACFESIQSLVERWGVVDDLELALAAADSGKPAERSPTAYFPDAPLTNRQLAAILSEVFEMTANYGAAAGEGVAQEIETAEKAGLISAKSAASLREDYRREAESCLQLTRKSWKTPEAAAVKGLAVTDGEYDAMQTLLEKYGTGGALLNADGTYTGTKKISEKALTDLLTYVFKLTPDKSGDGKLTIGTVELNPAAASVRRGKAATLLEYSLSAYADSLGAAGAAMKERIAAAGKPGPGPKVHPATKAAILNLQQIISGMNAVEVKYKTGAAELLPESIPGLEEIAGLIKRLPGGSGVEISVHTDSNGSESANVKLTQSRADAVRASLTKLGIPARILTARGYGSSKPLADNSTKEGRVKNRRTEFNVRSL